LCGEEGVDGQAGRGRAGLGAEGEESRAILGRGNRIAGDRAVGDGGDVLVLRRGIFADEVWDICLRIVGSPGDTFDTASTD
jgi:hypothetical protein